MADRIASAEDIEEFRAEFYEKIQSARSGFEAVSAMTRMTAAYAKLIDNQPQLVLTGKLADRDAAVGADERSIGLRFEYPLSGNLNHLRRDARYAACALGKEFRYDSTEILQSADHRQETMRCLTAVADYLEEQSSTPSDRLAVSIDYKEIDDREVEMLVGGAPQSFAADDAYAIVSSLALGRRFRPGSHLGNARFDISLSYEDVSNDPMRNDRTVAQATLSFAFMDATIPVTIVYANRPEFDLQDDDYLLSSSVGIRYDFKRSSGDTSDE